MTRNKALALYLIGTLPQVQACVMTHSLINVFSQLAIGGNPYIAYVCKIIIIITAVTLSIRNKNINRNTQSVTQKFYTKRG